MGPLQLAKTGLLKNSTDKIKDRFAASSRSRREREAELVRLQEPTGSRRNDLLPDCPLVRRRIADLALPRHQTRKVTAEQVQRVRRSLRAFGQVAPIMITGEGEVLDGVSRLEAARQEGLQEINCIVVGHLSEAELRLLRLSMNRIAERGEWDLGALKIEFEALSLMGAPLELTGFDTIEIDQIRLLDNDADQEPEIVGNPPERPVSQVGDVWVLDEHRLTCGDALEETTYATLWSDDDPAARLLLTDEPYNVRIKGHVSSGNHREFAMASGEMTDEEFLQFNCAWMERGLARLADGALLATFIDWRHCETVQVAARSHGLSHENTIVWNKTSGGQGSLWRSAHEFLPVFRKGSTKHLNRVELGKHGRNRTNVWTYPGASSLGSDARQGLALHPTTKPRAMLEDALLDVTEPGDLVLDPFVGSGSLILAAEVTKRRARAIEIDPGYVDVAIARWEALNGNRAILEQTGEAFDAVKARRSAEEQRLTDVASPPNKPRIRVLGVLGEAARND